MYLCCTLMNIIAFPNNPVCCHSAIVNGKRSCKSFFRGLPLRDITLYDTTGDIPAFRSGDVSSNKSKILNIT